MKFYSNTQISKKIEFRNNLKKAIRVITYPILIIMVLLVVYSIFQKTIEKNTEIRLWGYKAFVVKTGSMQNTIGIGDLILEKTPRSEEKLKIGDIISVKQDGGIITHRIIKIEINNQGKRLYTTKGDNNDSEDPEKATYENIEGVFIIKIPKIGEILMKFHSIEIICIIVLLTFVIYRSQCRKEEREIIRHEKRIKIEEEK